MSPLLYALPGNEAFAGLLAAAWPAQPGQLLARRFPDGESLVRLDTPPRNRDVALLCTLHDPDAKLMPLLFAADTARELGARSVGLVAPYLAYLRQDRSFHPGESRSAAHFARLVSAHFDWLVTVDPHLHRFHSLDEVYSIPTAAAAAAPLLAAWVAANVDRPLLIGPDDESRQWVTAIAREAGAPALVLEKVRRGDRDVEIRVPDLAAWAGYTPVLADDIIASGGTLAEVIRQLRARDAPPPVCLAVHAVFAPGAHEALVAAGAGPVVSTNAIPHPSSAIDVSSVVADACRNLLERLPRRGTERSLGAA